MIRFLLVSSVLVSILAFGQNCAPVHNEITINESVQFSSQNVHLISDDSPIYSVYPKESLGVNTDLIFTSFAKDIGSSQVRHFMWDHSMPGGVFCAQDVGPTKHSVLINCAEPGLLTLELIVELKSGEIVVYEATVEILKDAEPIPDEPIGPGPGLGGDKLFQIHCAGCHGPTDKVGRNAGQIQGAINANVGNMGALRALSSDEIQAIADYLKR